MNVIGRAIENNKFINTIVPSSIVSFAYIFEILRILEVKDSVSISITKILLVIFALAILISYFVIKKDRV